MIIDAETDELINQLNNETKTEQSAPPEFEGKEVSEAIIDDPDKPAKVEEPAISASQAQSVAMMWVKRFSSFMKIVFTPIYKKTILVKGDIEKMRDFTKANAGKSEREMETIIHSDHELAPVANRFERYVKAVDEIPLDKDEMEELAKPLSELIIKYKAMQLSPEWMLVIAIGFAMLPRLAHLMPDLSQLLSKSE